MTIDTNEKCKCGKPCLQHSDFCFPCLTAELLVAEYGMEYDAAHRLVKTNTEIVCNGIMSGNIRATAMALSMSRDNDSKVGE